MVEIPLGPMARLSSFKSVQFLGWAVIGTLSFVIMVAAIGAIDASPVAAFVGGIVYTLAARSVVNLFIDWFHASQATEVEFDG